MRSARNFPRQLMLIIEWFLITLLTVIRGGNVTPHAFKSNIGEMVTSLSDGPLVLPPLTHSHTFEVTSSLMQTLNARSLFLGIPYEDPHAHITKICLVCNSCVGRQEIDMYLIGLRVFHLSLTGEATIWFTRVSLQFNLYLGEIKGCVPSKVLPGF